MAITGIRRFGRFFLALAVLLGVLVACSFEGDSGEDSVAIRPRFAYVANGGDNTISIYTVDPESGQLRHNGYAVAEAGLESLAVIAIDPSGRFAYAANFGSDNVWVYTIYSTIGGGLIPGTAVAAGDGPRSVTIHPSGRFAYVANYNSNDILVYAISQTTGALTLRTTVSAGTCPISVTTCGVMQQGDAEVS